VALRKHLLKILFTVSLTYSVFFYVRLYSSINPDKKPQSIIYWMQPTSLNDTYPKLINSKASGFNYQKLENLVWQYNISPQGYLVVNSEIVNDLDSSCRYIDEDVSSNELLRIKFLIKKSLPNQAGIELSKLLPNYCTYAKELHISMKSINTVDNQEQLKLLKGFMPKLEQRQKELFGLEYSRVMFAEKNANLNYFNQRRIINLRQDLTFSEKQTQLLNLQKAYKIKLSGL